MLKRIIVLSVLFTGVYASAQTPTLCTQTSPCVQQCWFTAAVRSCTWVPASHFQGPKGDPGTNGTNGTNGQSATITVGTVTTGAPGTPATVTNAGTPMAAVFNFTIPQGMKGDPGPQIPGLTYTLSSSGTNLNLQGSFKQTALGTSTIILGNCALTVTPTGQVLCKPVTTP